MATNFPSSLDSLTNPTASDKLNSVTVPHATQHANVNDAVEALEAKVGVDGSAVTSSHDYILTNGVLPTLNVDSGVLVVDDTNNRVGVNDATPSYALDVTGDVNATGQFRIGGTVVGDAVAFTPSWTNFTPGNATESWHYVRVNDLLIVSGRTLLGSTSSVGFLPLMDFPVGTQVSPGATVAGRTIYEDSGGDLYLGFVDIDSSKFRFWVDRADATYVKRDYVSSATPMTWTTGDVLWMTATVMIS